MADPVELLKVDEVAKRIGLSRETIYRMVRDGVFPRPCYPTPKSSRWRSDEIAEFLNGLRSKRDAVVHAA